MAKITDNQVATENRDVQRRNVDFSDFDAVRADLQKLHENGYGQAGDWNLAQVCRHLTVALDQSINGFTFKAPWFVRKLIAPMIKGKLFRTRRIKPGIKAPADMVASSGGDQAQAVEGFLQVLGQVDQHRGRFQDHPVFGRLTDDQWRRFHLIHISHHLSFLTPR